MDRHGRRKDDRKRRKSFLLPTFLPIEQLNVQDVRQWQAGQQKLLEFHTQWYIELARQRSQSIDAIYRVLREASVPHEFSGWHRAFRYKWALGPLSSKGSLKVPGGRFNIGDIDERLFPKFPALYLAENTETALCEAFGPRRSPFEHLNQFELALVDETSFAVVATYGELESVIDLTQPECLKDFVEIIKSFHVSDGLVKMAQEVGIGLNGGTTKS